MWFQSWLPAPIGVIDMDVAEGCRHSLQVHASEPKPKNRQGLINYLLDSYGDLDAASCRYDLQ